MSETLERAAKRTWRRRCSRARHTKNLDRALAPLPSWAHPAWGFEIFDYAGSVSDDDGPRHPTRFIRAPWQRPLLGTWRLEQP